MTTTSEDRSIKIQALVGMTVALAIAVAGWVGLSRATQRGLDRLAAIDRARAQCERSWNAARTQAESLLVDRMALPDTIDPRSAAALDRCGDLRNQGSAAARPNPREMNGEPMPRGLR